MVLLVIDAQKEIVTERLYNFRIFTENIRRLICSARESGVEVIYVRHDDGEGGELRKGTEGFEHGFHVIVPAYTNTTVDNGYMTGEDSYTYYNEFIWNDRYAECISVEETIERFLFYKQVCGGAASTNL